VDFLFLPLNTRIRKKGGCINYTLTIVKGTANEEILCREETVEERVAYMKNPDWGGKNIITESVP